MLKVRFEFFGKSKSVEDCSSNDFVVEALLSLPIEGMPIASRVITLPIANAACKIKCIIY